MPQTFDGPVERLLDAEFSDLDQMCESVRSWDLDFRPLACPANGDRVGRIVQSRLGPFEFAHARFAASLDQFGSPPPGRVTFVVLEERMRRLWWRGHDLGNDTVLVFPVGSELRSFSGSDFQIHTVSVGEETIGEICEALECFWRPPNQRPEFFRPPPALLVNLRRALRLLRDERHAPSPAEARALVVSLVTAWLTPHGQTRARRPSMRIRDRAVRQCLELIEETTDNDLSPEILRRHCGVSERTLQYAFRERYGLTPAAFLKARRLAAVRTELLRAHPKRAEVGEVSARHGFWHVGQFAADYKRSFNELPSETLRRTGRRD